MAVEYKGVEVILSGKVFENELLEMKEYLDTQKKPLKIDLSRCDDMHGGIVQLLLAYKTVYGCEFTYSEKQSMYRKALEGFRTVEDDCNK